MTAHDCYSQPGRIGCGAFLSTPLLSEQKRCRVCAEKIEKDARKCIHCDCYQDWRGALPISTELLALMVALISVITAAAPVLANVFALKDSKLVVTFQDVDEGAVSVLVSNNGNRPGTVRYATLTIATNFPAYAAKPTGNKYIRLNVDGTQKHPAVLVQPGATVPINFVSAATFDSRWFFQSVGVERDNLNCELDIAVTNFSGKDGVLPISAPCDQFAPFVSSHVRFHLPDR